MKKNNLILSIILLFVLISCSNNRKEIPKKPIVKDIIKTYNLPEWLNVFPKNKSYTIGFAHKTKDKRKILEEAKQSAAIFSCRNSEAYSVHKKAIVRNYDERESRFDLNVSSNMEKVKMKAKNLIVVDSCKIDNYYIYLFDDKNKQRDYSSTRVIKTYQEKTSSADLIFALEKGFDNVRTKSAEYHRKRVMTSTTMINESLSKKGEIKTLYIVSGLKLKSIKICSKYQDSNIRYFVEINMIEYAR